MLYSACAYGNMASKLAVYWQFLRTEVRILKLPFASLLIAFWTLECTLEEEKMKYVAVFFFYYVYKMDI